jgi:acetyl-CoA acyltransferase
VGRLAWILSDGSYDVPACTMDRFCASGLNSIQHAVSTMMVGWGGDVQFAGGVQHMTHIPMGAGADLHPELGNYMNLMAINMGYTAEIVARRYGITREEQDLLSMESHMKAAKAQDEGKFVSIIPIATTIPKKDGSTEEMVVDKDQGVRRETTMESLGKMAPVFMQDELATVTAGNASQINDASAGVILATDEGCQKLGMKPLMKMVGFTVVGLDPDVMGIGPALAVPKVLKQAGITKDQIDFWEINEAFASQAAYCCKVLELPKDRTNIWGSGISIGHPLACTGARIAVDILHIFEDNPGAKYVMETMCIGHGQGAAAIWEKC